MSTTGTDNATVEDAASRTTAQLYHLDDYRGAPTGSGDTEVHSTERTPLGVRRRRTRPNVERSQADEALEHLAAACELGSSVVYRSNSFDCWKDALEEMTQVAGASSLHRQILGTVWTAVRRSDFANWSASQLDAMLEVAQVLRKPHLDELDAKRALEELRDQDVRADLGLSPPLGSVATDLEKRLEALVEGS